MPCRPRYQLALLALFTAYFIVWLDDPPYELHAAIHVVPSWVAIALLLLSTRYFPLSDPSFTLLIGFLSLHVLGTRYIYSFVPYDDWSEWLTGVRVGDVLGLSRNHYDRFVHFCFGLLVAPAAREVHLRLFQVKPAWSYVTAVEFVLASSLLFELAEWWGAMTLAPGFADSYLGQQGDAWDAHKDTALAAAGAAPSMLLAAAVSRVKIRRVQPSIDDT